MTKIELSKTGPDGLEEAYFKRGSFSHITGNRIKILPFTTKYSKDCDLDFRMFQGIVGECFRISNNTSFTKELVKDKENSFKKKLRNYIIDKALKKVDTDKTEDLEEVIIHLFFEDDGALIKFNNKMLPYMHFISEHSMLKETSAFIYDIFLTNDLLNQDSLTHSLNDNLFYKLIVECLPPLEPKPKSTEKLLYTDLLIEITELFRKDLNFLASKNELLLNHIEDLFKYYYFFYLSQLAIRLNTFGESKTLNPIYFSMDWETLSETRPSYNFGWKKIVYDLENLFAHANTIELLNFITINGENIGDYSSIVIYFKELTNPEQEILINKIKELSNFYKPQIEALKSPFKALENWEKCERILPSSLKNKKFNNEIQEELYSLFYRINYQFKNSGRDKPYNDYASWLIQFCKINYTKTRGRLGSTTVINQETLLFFTKICIADNEKIRLKELWNELEQRGLTFDEASKVEIVKLFERINLLEKKSDSGDAQYVKSII